MGICYKLVFAAIVMLCFQFNLLLEENILKSNWKTHNKWKLWISCSSFFCCWRYVVYKVQLWCSWWWESQCSCPAVVRLRISHRHQCMWSLWSLQSAEQSDCFHLQTSRGKDHLSVFRYQGLESHICPSPLKSSSLWVVTTAQRQRETERKKFTIYKCVCMWTQFDSNAQRPFMCGFKINLKWTWAGW